MNLLYKYNPQKGYYTSIVKRGESDPSLRSRAGLKYIDFGLLKFSETGSWGETVTNEEVALILLRGECELKITHDSGEINQVIGPRPNVFREKAYAAYIPKDSKYEIRTKAPAEIAVCKAPSELNVANPDEVGAEPAIIITPEQVKVKIVGQAVHEVTAERSEHKWKRQVHDIIDADVKARHLVVGETFNPPGNWSSSPPHRHDYENPPEECDMEEVYFFKIHPEQGFGVQRIYTDDLSLNETYTIENNDCVYEVNQSSQSQSRVDTILSPQDQVINCITSGFWRGKTASCVPKTTQITRGSNFANQSSQK